MAPTVLTQKKSHAELMEAKNICPEQLLLKDCLH